MASDRSTLLRSACHQCGTFPQEVEYLLGTGSISRIWRAPWDLSFSCRSAASTPGEQLKTERVEKFINCCCRYEVMIHSDVDFAKARIALYDEYETRQTLISGSLNGLPEKNATERGRM